jgi:hypothetical protein
MLQRKRKIHEVGEVCDRRNRECAETHDVDTFNELAKRVFFDCFGLFTWQVIDSSALIDLALLLL